MEAEGPLREVSQDLDESVAHLDETFRPDRIACSNLNNPSLLVTLSIAAKP